VKIILLLTAFATAAAAGATGFRDLSLDAALAKLRSAGLEILYSSDVVKPWMRVEREPASSEPRAQLAEILAPHGIVVADGPGGTLMLVREPPRAPRHAAPGTAHAPAAAPIDAVVVSASHYLFGEDSLDRPAVLGAAELERLPELGGDPVRAVARLPGTARQDFTSRTHLRGGAEDETLFRFDDLRLYNPYHLKDFFGIFSSIDPAIVSGIRVYTGGFPVAFGDRASGVVDIVPRLAGRPFQGEAVASLFSAGAALAGTYADGAGDWAVAARRGNMDLFLDLANSPLGSPEYYDAYARAGRRINDWLSISVNALVFDDRITAFDSDREESAVAEYRDQYTWLRFDLGDSDGLGGRVLASQTTLDSERIGSADLPGVGSGALSDERHFEIGSLQADGWWRLGAHTLLQAGVEWRAETGRYDYADEAAFELLFLTPGAATTPERSRAAKLRPSGHQAGAYLNWRIEPSSRLSADLGLRWDRSTLAGDDARDWSPRAVILWQPADSTRVRAGWGRYAQAQGINELQVPDGETRYQPAQRATQTVVSLEQDLAPTLTLRAEFYRKDYDHPFVRYENLLDPLFVLPELKPDRIRVAPESAFAEGMELSVRYARESLSGWLAYTQSRVRDRIDGVWQRRNWDQRSYVSAGLGWQGRRWDATAAAVWHDGWPTTAVELATLDPFPLVAVGKRNAGDLADYLRLDLRVARRFDVGKAGELTAFLELSNALQRTNDCCLEYQLEDSETADVFLDVEARGSLPLIPSLGVLWKF
jgi:outer membrane receptor protein involved in Fe transport